MMPCSHSGVLNTLSSPNCTSMYGVSSVRDPSLGGDERVWVGSEQGGIGWSTTCSCKSTAALKTPPKPTSSRVTKCYRSGGWSPNPKKGRLSEETRVVVGGQGNSKPVVDGVHLGVSGDAMNEDGMGGSAP
jgi:hypothetical protein